MSDTPSGSGSTTGVAWSALAISLVATPTVGYGAPGTGGSVNAHFLLHKGDWAYEEPTVASRSEALDDQEPRYEVTDALAHVRSALGLSISDLAAVLEVTRPTVYSWIKGEQEPRAGSWRRVRELQQVAQRAEAYELPRMSRLVRRPLPNGPSVLERLRGGDPVSDEVFRALAELAQAEQNQRDSGKGQESSRRSSSDAARHYGRPLV